MTYVRYERPPAQRTQIKPNRLAKNYVNKPFPWYFLIDKLRLKLTVKSQSNRLYLNDVNAQEEKSSQYHITFLSLRRRFWRMTNDVWRMTNCSAAQIAQLGFQSANHQLGIASPSTLESCLNDMVVTT